MEAKLTTFPERASEISKSLISELEKRGIFGFKELPDDLSLQIKTENETFINLLSFTTALDYMRDATKLWEASIKTYEDKSLNWVFTPQKVVERGKEELIEALSIYKLAIRKNRDSNIWFTISESLVKNYDGSFIKLFEAFNFDVEKMFNLFAEKPYKELFPSLSGRKIFPHWIRILKEKTSINFLNVKKLPIPVDVHVARATFTTGCIRGKYSSKGISDKIRKLIINLWFEALSGSEINPIDMFRPLWLLSKHGCHFRKDSDRPKLNSCPVKEFCVDGLVEISAKKVNIDT